jgi:cbb3-type cytochrome oxidase subunit 3
MYHEYFIQKGVLLLPVVAMLAFVVTFFSIVVATYRSSRRAELDTLSQLPLSDDSDMIPNLQAESAQRQDR